jgi:hypothetical protein
LSRRAKVWFAVVLLGALVAGGLRLTGFGKWFALQLAIDSCLDRGGRWNYEKNVGEYGNPPEAH